MSEEFRGGQSFEDKPQQVERREEWDPTQRTLVVETTEKLEVGLREVIIRMTQGRIVVEGSEESTPRLVTRLSISASSEEEARKVLGERGDEFKITRNLGLISVDARSQEGVVLGGGNVVIGGGRSVVVSGDLIGGVVIGGGEVWINGRRVDPSRGGTQVVPSAQREVILSVPKTNNKFRYNLETQAGSVEIRNTGGNCIISTSSAEVKIAEYEGNASLNTQSGDVDIDRFKGNLSINATSGDVEIENFDGSLNAVSTSGDVKLGRAIFRGVDNNLRATSGDIRVGVANDELLISAETLSGKIRTPQSSEFVIIREDRHKKESGVFGRGNVIIASGVSIVSIGGSGGRSFVEGRFGQSENPENRLRLSATSGDITIAKS
jgi:hypothetical protein